MRRARNGATHGSPRQHVHEGVARQVLIRSAVDTLVAAAFCLETTPHVSHSGHWTSTNRGKMQVKVLAKNTSANAQPEVTQTTSTSQIFQDALKEGQFILCQLE